MVNSIEFRNQLMQTNLSELEMIIALDMFVAGYDYNNKADIIEYWSDRI
jgi:hypothetical protein